MNKNISKEVMDMEMGIEAILAIIEGAPAKEKAPVAAKSATGHKVETASECVWQNGQLVEVDGKKITKGYTPKKMGGARAKADDAGKKALKDLYTSVVNGHTVYGKNSFNHSSEGLVVRMEEADYTLKVIKSKEFKFDVAAEDFEVEKDFTVRGKAKNSAPGIARAILTALEASDMKYELISAKASGIILQMMGGEYTVKISKKRDRVGFEAEKGAAYDK